MPNSEIPGSKVVSTYPRLIAGSHVLHRLLVPRHPPYALSNLTEKSSVEFSNQTTFSSGTKKKVNLMILLSSRLIDPLATVPLPELWFRY